MQEKAYIEEIGTVTYSETFFLGRKELYVDDVLCKKVGKKEYSYTDKDGNTANLSLKGSFISGVTISNGAKNFTLISKPKWYELFIFMLIVLFPIIWGNNVATVEVLPVFGGAVGGAIGGAFAVMSLYTMRFFKRISMKMLVGIGIFALSIFFNFAMATLVFSLFT